MPYELFVGWRYLYSARQSAAIWAAFVIGATILAAGIGFFFYATSRNLPPDAVLVAGLSAVTAKTVAAIAMLVGGLSAAGAGLLLLFSTFTAISILGVAIGVSILIWVLSVTSGFQQEFRTKVLGVNAHILVIRYGEFHEYRDVMRAVEKMPGVVSTAPFVFNEMMVAKGQRLSGILVKGVDPDRVGRVLDLPSQIAEPRRIKASEMSELLVSSTDAKGRSLKRDAGIVIGRELAKKLDAQVGDQLRLISPLSGLDISGWSAGAEIPRSRDFRITGIFFSGFNEYDKRLVYVHMREVQNFLDQGDIVTGVDLKVRDVFQARRMARNIAAALGAGKYRTIDWSELNHNLFTALAIQKVFLQLVIGLIVFVAAFNVLAALAMLVIRKTREVSILKSMGMSAAGVARIFQSTGIIVWALGTGLGLLWGYLGGLVLRRYGFPLDPKVYHISELPVRMDPWEFIATAGFALLVCVLATLYPAIRAARLDPVTGLRYE